MNIVAINPGVRLLILRPSRLGSGRGAVEAVLESLQKLAPFVDREIDKDVLDQLVHG